MPTFVTGGTGFIGHKLVHRLRQSGEAVHVLARKTSDLSGLRQEGVRVFYGDVTDRASLKAPMQGCDRVFHLAAYARNWARHPSVYVDVNVGGFKNVAETALESGVGKMVFTSTSLTLGPSDGETVNEETPRKTDVFFTPYEETKHLAEIEGAALAERGLPLVILNPTRVYGPGKLTEGNSVSRMVEMFLNGKFPFILGKGEEIGNYVYVDDVVDGHLRAMSDGRAGQKYILGGENVSLNDFFTVLSQLTGKEPPGFHLPAFAARLFARFEELKAWALGVYPLITSGWMDVFLHDWAFSSQKARAELGYSSRNLKEGLEITCDWLKGDQGGEP